MTKYYLSDCEAAIILQVLEKVRRAGAKSPVMLAALDIDQHDIEKVSSVLKRLDKPKRFLK